MVGHLVNPFGERSVSSVRLRNADQAQTRLRPGSRPSATARPSVDQPTLVDHRTGAARSTNATAGQPTLAPCTPSTRFALCMVTPAHRNIIGHPSRTLPRPLHLESLVAPCLSLDRSQLAPLLIFTTHAPSSPPWKIERREMMKLTRRRDLSQTHTRILKTMHHALHSRKRASAFDQDWYVCCVGGIESKRTPHSFRLSKSVSPGRANSGRKPCARSSAHHVAEQAQYTQRPDTRGGK